ncbi:MAG: hypothetical protein JNN01_17920 [Opitutaceae bacterium]|nr:hypothetical protein [Opitutaceae bacterium]
MKSLLFVGCALALSALAVQAEAPLNEMQRLARLRSLPITLYPEVSLPDSTYPAFMNRHARPDDAVVLSHLDAFKGSARISQLGITRGQVWVHVTGDRDLTQKGRRNIEGASAILYVPSSPTSQGSSDLVFIEVGGVARSAEILQCPLVVGLEPGDARTYIKVRDVAARGSTLTIYDNQKLRGGPQAYRKYVERLVKEARAANPSIRIEVAVSTGANETATRTILDTLAVCADLADRIGIYCDDTPESQRSLSTLYAQLRDDTST